MDSLNNETRVPIREKPKNPVMRLGAKENVGIFIAGSLEVLPMQVVHPESSSVGSSPYDALIKKGDWVDWAQELHGVAPVELNSKLTQMRESVPLRDRVASRFGSIYKYSLHLMEVNGTDKPRLSNEQFAKLMWQAIQIETDGQAYMSRLRRFVQETAMKSPQDAAHMERHLKDNYVQWQLDQLYDAVKPWEIFVATRVANKNVDTIGALKPAEKGDRGERLSPEELEWGRRWKSLSMEEQNKSRDQTEVGVDKVAILMKIRQKHRNIIEKSFSGVPMGQKYFYFYLRPYDMVEHKKNESSVNNVSNLQDSFVDAVSEMGAQDFLKIPTRSLGERFVELEGIAKEVKVHLMPNLMDEPAILNRILTIFEKQPQMRDLIQAIKIKQTDNGTADNLPEIVLYTTNDHAQSVVNALLQEFHGLRGNGLIPRFNRQIDEGGLVFLAQSGGDLKERLLEMGILDKVFSKGTNYSQIRI